MDLYFHNSPKKRSFSLPFIKRKSSVNFSELTQKRKASIVTVSSSVTDFLQKQLTKKFKAHKIFPSKHCQTSVQHDSNKEIKIPTLVLVPPPLPPRKPQVIPSSSSSTDYLLHRALPSLPDETQTKTTTSLRKWLIPQKEEKSNIIQKSSNTPKRMISNMFAKKMTLRCKILQITNLSSERDYHYTMQLSVTNSQTQTHTGTLRKIAQGISAAHPQKDLLFHVRGQFQFACDISLSEINAGAADLKRGKLTLSSGENPVKDFGNKGIRRYSIQTSTLERIEITIALWIEDNTKEYTPAELDIQRYCQMGDYLTFYQVNAENQARWTRYWVTYRLNHLLLKVSEMGGEPIDKIPLTNISQVDINPTMVGIKQNYVIELTIENSSIYLYCDNYKSLCYWKCLFEKHKKTSCDN